MRVFFVFDIKKEFISLYYDTPRSLYRILKQIYYLEKDEIAYGTNIYFQIVKRVEKQRLDNFLFMRLHQDIPYSKRGHVHHFNNLYLNEVSQLIVKNSYIKISSEKDISSFFDILGDFDNNYFVCDFDNQDYFFLSNVKTLV